MWEWVPLCVLAEGLVERHGFITTSHLTCRTTWQETWTRRTLTRTTTANQATAWTTKRTGLLRSTGPILVAMATDCHSKASICQTQRRPDKRIEVTKQGRRVQKDLWMIIDPDRQQEKKLINNKHTDKTWKPTEFQDYQSWINILC